MITDLTKLTADIVVSLLEKAGYNESSQDIFSVIYDSVKNGQVKYKISYFDIDANECDGYVYVFIGNDGILTADY